MSDDKIHSSSSCASISAESEVKAENGTNLDVKSEDKDCARVTTGNDKDAAVTVRLDPFVRLIDLGGAGEALSNSLKRKVASTSMVGGVKLSKPKGSNISTESSSLETSSLPGISSSMPLESTPNVLSEGHSLGVVDMDVLREMGLDGETSSPSSPSIVKPRRASVHFAETELKFKPSSSMKQDNGSRKHRSRKEKLVCRSENLSDLSMDAPEERSVTLPSSPSPVPQSITFAGVTSTITVSVPSPICLPSLSLVKEPANQSQSQETPSTAMKPPVAARVSSGGDKVKQRVKRVNNASRGGISRKRAPSNIGGPFLMGGIKDPIPIRKKRVIEIVSPRKRKMDHLELVKTSSDPIFVRAANKTSKLKNKSHNPYKFSRANLNRSNSQQELQQRIRRASTSSIPVMSPSKSGFGMKRFGAPESEQPAFPLTCVDELMWLLREAEKEFSPDRAGKIGISTSGPFSSPSQSVYYKSGLSLADTVAGNASVSRKLQFGRRRVESEPPSATGLGFEMAPGSPGNQSVNQFRKEIYFSPSPSYAATGPAGRRRYSRRRHAKIHPPFDDSNCYFQGHHCPSPKVPGSQYCEKHLDQGPSSGYVHCRYIKDGRPCSNLIPTFDPSATFFASERFCELHANLIARTEFDQRNPKSQQDQAKNILAKISKICTEGFGKNEVDSFGGSSTNPDILQIIEEPEVIEDLPLNTFCGGLVQELDSEGERNVNCDKPDYDALKNAGYYTTEEIVQIHIHKLKKLKTLYQREKELEWLLRQQKLRFYRDGLEKLKQYGTRFTTNPYLINKNIEMPKEYIEHQIREYDAAKAILQTAYKADGGRGLLRLKMLQKTQELARIAKAKGQKQHNSVDICGSDSDAESDSGETKDAQGASQFLNMKPLKCAYNEGYAIQACQNPPVHLSNYCFKHILSDTKQVQWIPCNRRIGPDIQDTCKTPCFKILEKHGCVLHSPLVMSKHKPLRRSEEELNILMDSDNEEEEVSLENESLVLANLVSDECVRASHLDEAISKLTVRGPLEQTDTSDSEETDEEGVSNTPTMASDDAQENHIV